MWLLRALRSRLLFPTHPTQRHASGAKMLSVTLALAMLLATGLMVARPGQAHADGVGTEHSIKDYLALGDSVPFGYSPLVDPAHPENFIGYPDVAASALGVQLTNAACPGATSSYLDSLAGPDWECIPFRTHFPLHVSYSTSQLDFAVAFLRSHPQTRLVTLTIGANDAFRLQFLCGGNVGCIESGLPTVLATLSANLDTLYGAIRDTAHYQGQLVALTYYSTDYRDAFTTGVVEALDKVIAARTAAWGGVVADGFSAFAAAAQPFGGDSCAAGLLIRLSATTCNIHPSALGRSILGATVVAVVKHNDATSISG